MEDREFAPLGFSDLTDEEALIIALFRDWSSGNSDRIVVENRLIECLKYDQFYESLKPLFEFFRTLPVQIGWNQQNFTSLLSFVEESILNEIGSNEPGNKLCLERLKIVLISNNTTIRPATEIPRSGHDQLNELVNMRALNVYQLMHPV